MADDRKVYVGNLPGDIRERDLEDMFYKYGKIIEVDLHTRKGIPFAFIEFDDHRQVKSLIIYNNYIIIQLFYFRDAEDAIRGKDGYMFDGCRLRVEYPRGSRQYGGGGGGGRSGGGGRGGGYGRSGGGGMRGRRPKGYQLSITGLPPTGSWQDIKVRNGILLEEGGRGLSRFSSSLPFFLLCTSGVLCLSSHALGLHSCFSKLFYLVGSLSTSW